MVVFSGLAMRFLGDDENSVAGSRLLLFEGFSRMTGQYFRLQNYEKKLD